MKKAVFVVLQALLLIAAYFAGAVLAALGKLPKWTSTINAGHSQFTWDGIVLLLAMFLLILLVQAGRKVIRTHWSTPVLALVLSLLLLAAMKFPMAIFTPTGPAMM